MHLGTRDDEDRGRTRTVVWTEGSESDLGVLVAASLATTVFASSVVGAAELHGIPHVVTVVLAVVSGIYAALMIVPLLLVIGGAFVVKGLLAERPSTTQRTSWVVAAALLGALLGSDAYSVGLPGLLTGPLVVAIVVVVLGARPNHSPRARRRVLALTGVIAVAALAVGLTIFL